MVELIIKYKIMITNHVINNIINHIVELVINHIIMVTDNLIILTINEIITFGRMIYKIIR